MTPRDSERGKVAAAVSNAIVGIHRQYFGRGASRARTVMGADTGADLDFLVGSSGSAVSRESH